MEIPRVDEPKGGLEDRQKDAHLDSDVRTHVRNVPSLRVEVGVADVHKRKHLRRPDGEKGVLDVDDEVFVASLDAARGVGEDAVVLVERQDGAGPESAQTLLPPS
jgi:hypothetical protein